MMGTYSTFLYKVDVGIEESDAKSQPCADRKEVRARDPGRKTGSLRRSCEVTSTGNSGSGEASTTAR